MSYIKGMDSLLSKLNALPGIIQESTRDGVRTTVNEIKKDAKTLCPVESGSLRDSIVADVKIDGNKTEGTVTSQKDYALAVEFGTGQYGAQSQEINELGIVVPHDTSFKGRAPTPFMYPAYILHKKTFEEDIKNRVSAGLKGVAKS